MRQLFGCKAIATDRRYLAARAPAWSAAVGRKISSQPWITCLVHRRSPRRSRGPRVWRRSPAPWGPRAKPRKQDPAAGALPDPGTAQDGPFVFRPPPSACCIPYPSEPLTSRHAAADELTPSAEALDTHNDLSPAADADIGVGGRGPMSAMTAPRDSGAHAARSSPP